MASADVEGANGIRVSRGLSVGLWIVQGLLCLTFVGTGVWKLVTPLPEVAAAIPWAGDTPPAFFYCIAVIDLLGGVGVLLPSLTRIRPGLAVAAALGCLVLMIFAVVFHLWRGEGANTPFNVFVAALCGFVIWGRWSKAPIPSRG